VHNLTLNQFFFTERNDNHCQLIQLHSLSLLGNSFSLLLTRTGTKQLDQRLIVFSAIWDEYVKQHHTQAVVGRWEQPLHDCRRNEQDLSLHQASTDMIWYLKLMITIHKLRSIDLYGKQQLYIAQTRRNSPRPRRGVGTRHETVSRPSRRDQRHYIFITSLVETETTALITVTVAR